MDILSAIGNTTMVRLSRVVPAGCAEVYAKLEWENPTGSMKDRMALAVISRAEEDGRLAPGDTVIEYTGGSTGARHPPAIPGHEHSGEIRCGVVNEKAEELENPVRQRGRGGFVKSRRSFSCCFSRSENRLSY